MATTSQSRGWELNKEVLVYTPEYKVSCHVGLRIVHDNNAHRGSITLSITADLANPRITSQVRLNIPPDRVKNCELYWSSNDSLCPSGLIIEHPASINNLSLVSTLRLELGEGGIVLCPSKAKYLSPADTNDTNFHAFAKVCRSQSLCLLIAHRQFAGAEYDRLKNFTSALQNERLQNVPFDHARQNMVPTDWHIFSSSVSEQVDPPPYCEKHVSQEVLGTRRRASNSMPCGNKRRRTHVLSSPQPVDSSTEAATPSPSPSICPTYFTRAVSPGRAERNRFACLVHELRSLPDDVIRKLLNESEHGHLLDKRSIREAVDSDLPSESEKVELIKRRGLKGYVDKIKRDISQVFDEIIDGAESKFDDRISDQCNMHIAELREEFDDGISEVRNTTNEYLKEIEEAAQKCVHEIEERKDQCMIDIQHQGIDVETSVERRLKHRFNASPRPLFDRKPSPSHELGTDARRSSI
ncbi:hypothetical protein BDV24DRAFT_169467 [Aspergillus arachidicola]|uniref:Uncharacterized protein n=1 Tax=Aspergillus arachidicola TaxID=656916 RepID=A0A5N6XPQ6_9EURO|nr:hypothetical protein BDV24DRAFT_169467 [Aspergillus arachidicola]